MTDPRTIRIVIIAVAVLAALSVVGGITLDIRGLDASNAWQAAGTFGGVLGAVLVSTRSTADPATSEAIEAATTQAREAGGQETIAGIVSAQALADAEGAPPAGAPSAQLLGG